MARGDRVAQAIIGKFSMEDDFHPAISYSIELLLLAAPFIRPNR